MASSTRRELMNSELCGSVLAFIPPKKKECALSRVQEPVKLTHLQNTQEGVMRAMRSLHAESGTETSEVKLGYSDSHPGFLTYSQEEIRQV